jgi:hypothetical protein
MTSCEIVVAVSLTSYSPGYPDRSVSGDYEPNPSRCQAGFFIPTRNC